MFPAHKSSVFRTKMPRAHSVVSRRRLRRAMTLIELVLASAVMAVIMAALGALANGVYDSNEYCEGYGTAMRHARVAVGRIERSVQTAYATPDYPGAWIVTRTSGSVTLPDRLVVWCPTDNPTNAAGPPMVRELKIYAPSNAAPNQLLEITAPTDTRTAPAITNNSSWQTIIDGLQTSNSAQRVLLTEHVRTATTSSTGTRFAALRFAARVRPDAASWTSYKAGSTDWNDLNWVQDIHGSTTGLRQTWIRFEMQLSPPSIGLNGSSVMKAVPFFGSGALYYELKR